MPLEIAPDEHGLFTRVKVFDGPAGDNLLAVAKGLKAAGQTLGLSIGYRVRDARMERTAGKSVRVLTDIDLIEFSYAARQTVANPEALMTDVKALDEASSVEPNAQGGGMCTVEKQGDRFHVMRGGESLASYATEDEAKKRAAAMNAESGKALLPNTLPDSAFLYIASGGQLDDEGKTVPRTHRHFRYRDEAGALDADALAVTLTEIPQAKTVMPDDRERARLYGHARRLAGADSKTFDAPEWRSETALDLLSVAYGLIDVVNTLAEQHKALAVVGQTTNNGRRMPAAMREQVEQASKTLAAIAEQALLVEQGKDESALADWWQAQFSLLEVAS